MNWNRSFGNCGLALFPQLHRNEYQIYYIDMCPAGTGQVLFDYNLASYQDTITRVVGVWPKFSQLITSHAGVFIIFIVDPQLDKQCILCDC